MEDLLKKITLEVVFKNEPAVQLLMKKLNFKEVSRIATGGLHSNPALLITFEGYEKDYHEKGYVTRSETGFSGKDYITIKDTFGSYYEKLEYFLKENEEKGETFEYNEI